MEKVIFKIFDYLWTYIKYSILLFCMFIIVLCIVEALQSIKGEDDSGKQAKELMTISIYESKIN